MAAVSSGENAPRSKITATIGEASAINPTVALNNQFGSWHSGGICQFVFADGSVRGVQNSTPGSVLGLLANRMDGQVIPSFE